MSWCELIDWLFTVLRSAQEYFSYMQTSPLPMKGCKILAYAWLSWLLSREGSLSCHTCCDTGLSFSGLIWRTAPFSHPLMTRTGCRGPILTQILTGVMMWSSLYEILIRTDLIILNIDRAETIRPIDDAIRIAHV
jgi:hypothetical protein